MRKKSSMKYTKLGNSGIEISRLCLGCMSFGVAGTMHNWTLDEKGTNLRPEGMKTVTLYVIRSDL